MSESVIIPVVCESEWTQKLAGVPPLEITANRIVLVAPHPDDEVLGAGAFLAAQCARGAEIVIAAVTDGENAYAENHGLATLRRKEQAEAVHNLNIPPANIRRFGLTDSAVASSKATLVELLLPLVNADTLILAPWTGDYHPDHEACGLAAREVSVQTGASLLWYFFWTWHRGTPADLAGLDLRLFPVDDALLGIKLKALACHRSQLRRAEGEPILSDQLLAPARRNFEVFANA